MAAPDPELLAEVVAIARQLPPGVVEQVCSALEELEGEAGAGTRRAISQRVPQPDVRAAVLRLLRRWRSGAPEGSARELAWALRGADAVDQFYREWQSVEVVWTGPTPFASAVRRTDQALLELIRAARQSLTIVTFAAYRIPEVAMALVQAADRGVTITLIVESPEASEGKVTFGAIHALGSHLAARSSVFLWPLDRRPRDATGRHGSLHVKCAVADDQLALLSSANLTDYAFNLNMELGVLIRGGDIPRAVSTHLRRLIGDGILVQIATGP